MSTEFCLVINLIKQWFNSHNFLIISRNNESLYFSIGILFAITVIGPAFGYVMSSALLRFYVDVDKSSGKSDMPRLLHKKVK